MTRKSTRTRKTKTVTARAASTTPRPESKKARLIARLQNPRGVDVATLSAELGWQPHSTRAALTGLRKEGYTIERLPSESGKPACYRITGAKG